MTMADPYGQRAYGRQPFATGRTRYGGGTTYAPTMGQVDPVGYKDREVRNRAKVSAMQKWLAARRQGADASPDALKMGRM